TGGSTRAADAGPGASDARAASDAAGAGGAAGTGGAPGGGGAVSVLTQKYDNARTGWNANEKILTPANVEMSFGRLFTRKVDGQIYAQPLVVSAINIGGKVRNAVYVITTHNSAYAFDADDGAQDMPLWQANLGPT